MEHKSNWQDWGARWDRRNEAGHGQLEHNIQATATTYISSPQKTWASPPFVKPSSKFDAISPPNRWRALTFSKSWKRCWRRPLLSSISKRLFIILTSMTNHFVA
ncbi:hypothetical protein PGTUg99_014041 [Puccinia graminis f. sp. tritici]|uniref:Uncharacterized protein n=1 Tax=Puccinia graminis f. sp. tritici TaxID=56615 RepID=A0A5B0NB99_PUCGR|nr:hypothetical protein PGTUg99_014041 [Puccinia graminis f. sp. tritici]